MGNCNKIPAGPRDVRPKISEMKEKPVADRIAGAVWGALIADAMAMPTHWYYGGARQIIGDFGGPITTYTTSVTAQGRASAVNSIMALSNTGGAGRGGDEGSIIGDVINHGKKTTITITLTPSTRSTSLSQLPSPQPPRARRGSLTLRQQQWPLGHFPNECGRSQSLSRNCSAGSSQEKALPPRHHPTSQPPSV